LGNSLEKRSLNTAKRSARHFIPEGKTGTTWKQSRNYGTKIPMVTEATKTVDRVHSTQDSRCQNDEGRGVMAHACNPSYMGDGDQEDLSSRPARAVKLMRPHLANKTGCDGVCLPSQLHGSQDPGQPQHKIN
jgi:hypothetical protein